MTFVSRCLIVFLVFFSVDKMSAQRLVSQSPKLIKSVLTQAGSSNVTYQYTDIAGTLKTTKIQQSIGQRGVVGLSNTSLSAVQQGYLNHVKVFKVDNTDSEFAATIDVSIYPNTFTDFVNIKFSKVSMYTIYIEVFDIRGRLVLKQEFQASSLISVATDRLQNAASYVMRVSSGSQEFLEKLIKGIN